MPAVPAIIMAGANIAGTALSAHSQNSVARQQAAAAERAAQIQAKAEADALAFQREQEAARQREWQQTQDYNAQQYAQEFGYQQQQDALRQQNLQDQIARRAPFRQLGLNAMGQLLQPVTQRVPAGSLPTPGTAGALLGGGR